MLSRFLHHVGRRGAVLLFLAELDFIVGYSLTAPLPYGLTRAGAYGPQIAVMPIAGWMVAWLVVGALCAVAACWRWLRAVTFAAAMLLKVAWGSTYLIGWADGQVTRGYLSAVIWFTFAAVVLAVSGWQENR